MITVMGATGRTGTKVTDLLLKSGERVRAIGRSEDKLAELERAGADVQPGDTSDATFLTHSFRGASAVYTLLPFDPRSADHNATQRRQSEVVVQAVRDSGVKYVVALSSIGADRPSGTGLIASLHDHEQRLRALAADQGVNVLLLRAGLFFESFHDALPLIESEGINGDSVAPDVALPMIATRDIAHAAATALAARDWSGVVVRELLGPRDLTYAEVTRIIGDRIGKPGLEYVQFPYADVVHGLNQAGFSGGAAGLYAEMTRAFNEGLAKSVEGRRPENSTPTRFEDFAVELAGAMART